jgi:hypothetical protein
MVARSQTDQMTALENTWIFSCNQTQPERLLVRAAHGNFCLFFKVVGEVGLEPTKA